MLYFCMFEQVSTPFRQVEQEAIERWQLQGKRTGSFFDVSDGPPENAPPWAICDAQLPEAINSDVELETTVGPLECSARESA